MRSCEDAKLRRGYQKIWRAEDAKMRSCGEGFRKSGEPKLRSCEDVKLRRGFQKIWRAEDAKMRRGFQKILRAEVAKLRRCEAAERVSENLDSPSCEAAKMRRCDAAEAPTISADTMPRRCEAAMLR